MRLRVGIKDVGKLVLLVPSEALESMRLVPDK